MLPVSTRDPARFTPPDALALRASTKAQQAQGEGADPRIESGDTGIEGADPLRQSDSAASPAPVYLIAVATLRERIDFRRALAATGARFPSNGEIVARIAALIDEIVLDEDRPAARELVAEFEAASAAGEPPADLLTALDRFEQKLRPHDAELSQMAAERTYWIGMAPLIAASVFLRGWENLPVKFIRRRGCVPEDVLWQLPESHVVAIGWRALELMNAPTGTAAKN